MGELARGGIGIGKGGDGRRISCGSSAYLAGHSSSSLTDWIVLLLPISEFLI
jgi:hypothetical protein